MNVIKEEINKDDSYQERISNIAKNNLTKLVNFWQILIKSIEEIRYAPNQEQAGSMAIIKLCYGTLLPDPSTLLKQLSNTQESKPGKC
jgi:DNA polymerase III gamma/tau subunit